MRALGLPFFTGGAGVAPLVARVIVGVIMAAHGLDKLLDGPAGFAETLTGLGLPAPLVLAWVVTAIELGGGALLIVGALTRIAALLHIAVLVGAIALVKIDLGLIAEQGVGAELDLALIAGLIVVALLGPGRPSVDHAVGIEHTEPAATPTSPAAVGAERRG